MTASVARQNYVLPKPLIVTLSNLKGGVGKSTSAFFLAVFFAKVLGLRVLYIDADPLSQTGYAWYRRLVKHGLTPPFELMPFPSVHLVDYVDDHGSEWDVIVIDIGGESPEILKAAVPITDELLLVTSTSSSEYERIPPTYRAAEAAITEYGQAHPGQAVKAIRVRVLLTKVPVTKRDGVNVSTEYREAVEDLEGAEYDILRNYASAWKWYRSAANGKVGKGGENPLVDLGEYEQIGLEVLEAYLVAAAEEVTV